MGYIQVDALTARYGPLGLRPVGTLGSRPRPQASNPPVASRTPSVPLPKTTRQAQQSAAVQAAKPAPAPTAPEASAPAVLEPKRPPQIMPTQELPKVQGLD